MSDLATSQNSEPQSAPLHGAGKPSTRSPIQRGDRARKRVLRAALEVLAAQGLSGFTMEAIAHRAGASKATVYRHWTALATLLVDAMDSSFQPFPLPATGRLLSGLIELLSRFEALVSGQRFPRLMVAFIDAAERDPTLASLHVQLTERRREPIRHVLAQARQRGDIPASTDLELAVDLLAGARLLPALHCPPTLSPRIRHCGRRPRTHRHRTHHRGPTRSATVMSETV
jgi:AcrR family transcriptional regulator